MIHDDENSAEFSRPLGLDSPFARVLVAVRRNARKPARRTYNMVTVPINWDTFKADSNGSDPWDTTQGRVHNDANEISTIDTSSDRVGYSAHGNMTKVPVPGDEANHHYACTYDAWGRLVKVQDDSSNTIAEYRHDGLGRRIRKYTPDGNDWRVREFYYNSAWQLLEVRKDTGKSRTGDPLSEPSLAATLHKQFVWSIRYIDAPVLRDRDGDDDGETGDLGASGSGLEERLYYMTDQPSSR